ncbi:hypothetical protein SDC9_165531 [bioreactor metagenome]|uniref:Uncharacterized protein n=1 Tax=bioreactor metagenome TaxID=1076179 RepID=A0A645G1V0_9ZZZZ
MAIITPGITRAGFGNEKAELRIRNDVDPRRGRVLALQVQAILLSIGPKSADAVVIEQRRFLHDYRWIHDRCLCKLHVFQRTDSGEEHLGAWFV